MTLIAATDGSSLGNPGPAGWAWYVDSDRWQAGALKESTNNVGELLAVLNFLKATSGVEDDLLIYADSQYVINALTKWRFSWKRKGWKKADGKPVANRDLMQALDQAIRAHESTGFKIKFEWVRGHNDHEMNEKADDLARGAAEAIRDGRKIDEGPGFAGASSGESKEAGDRSEEAGAPNSSAHSEGPDTPSSSARNSSVSGSSSPADQAGASGPKFTVLQGGGHAKPGETDALFDSFDMGEPDLFSFDEDAANQCKGRHPSECDKKRAAAAASKLETQAHGDETDTATASAPTNAATPAHGEATQPKETKNSTAQAGRNAPRTTATPSQATPDKSAPSTPEKISEMNDLPDHTRVTYFQHGAHVTEHRLRVPLDYEDPNGPQIQLFAREVTLDPNGPNLDQPAIIFMQGGPGGRAPRPGNFKDGWIGQALKTHRVILMDERGTGLSTRLDALTLSEFDSVADQVNYVKHFRADSIVEDAERLRAVVNGGKPWASLGQSYGGFINTAYLSRHPEGLSAVYFTGGLPGLTSIDEIYRRTYAATAARNEVYFNRYPADRVTLRNVLKHLDTHQELLPTGERLSPRRLRMLGMLLGTTTGFDQLHYFFEEPFTTIRGEKRLNTQFLDMVARQVSMGDSPMYAVLHETIYAGAVPALKGQPTAWGAHRLLDEVGAGISEGFAPQPDYDSDAPIYLTGEHIYPFLFDEDPALSPMKELAYALADFTDWEPLYYPETLSENETPAAAAVYFEDMFVPLELSLATAEVAGVRPWVTNEYQHDGLRADGAKIFKRLTELAQE